MAKIESAGTEMEAIEIDAPPSKSLSHRYMIGAALAHGESILENTLESDDLEATRGILCEAGARMKPLHDDAAAKITGWKIWGMPGLPEGGKERPLQCDVNESGTTCRLLTAVLAAGMGKFHIFGHGRMHDRPIRDLCDVLTSLGSDIQWLEKSGCPPVLLDAHGLDPALVDGYARVSMDQSSQYFSGLLMAAPLAKGPLCLEISGQKPVSWPYVGLTLQCLDDFGIRFTVESRPRIGVPWIALQKSTWRTLEEARPGCLRVRVWPGEYRPGSYRIEGDWSGASYFLAAGALAQRPVRIRGLASGSLQGDRVIVDIMRQMGAKVQMEENSVTVYPSSLHGITVDMGSCPDLVPTVATLAAFAKGSTRITNVAHLRLKESDRIEAPARELSKAGVTVDPLSDGLLVNGLGGLKGHVRNRPDCPKLGEDVSLCAHNDHRIAMALALLEIRDPEAKVRQRLDDSNVVRKSFPDFWELWDRVK